MFDIILQKEVQDFINKHLLSDVQQLALKKNPFPELDYKLVLTQISSKRKAKEKLPTWFAMEGIIYPEKISIEQTSSEKTAQYKANLVSGAFLMDATGGFGIDDYYFSKKIGEVVHCEINVDLSALVKHNFEKLGVTNITCVAGDSFDYLNNTTQKFDWIYIDPSRRNSIKGKVFLLADCMPNVPELIDFYFKKAERILIKTAPILDITSALNELKFVKNIHIIAIDNEVKELLFEAEGSLSGASLEEEASGTFTAGVPSATKLLLELERDCICFPDYLGLISYINAFRTSKLIINSDFFED